MAFYNIGEKKDRPGVYKRIVNLAPTFDAPQQIPGGGDIPEPPKPANTVLTIAALGVARLGVMRLGT